MSLPLADIRVVEFTQALAGPAATVFLADQGATVIKVEPPEGVAGRAVSSTASGLLGGSVTLNRNKRSVVIDMTKPQGRELAYRLARWADVIVVNMRAGSPQRLGIGYEDLAAINPRLIYASITAYGEAGPEAMLPGYDIVMQAKSGSMAQRRQADGTPNPTFVYSTDYSGAMLTACGVTMALHQRELTGQGQKIQISLLHTALALQAVRLIKIPGASQGQLGTKPIALATCYPCVDGTYINIMATTNEQWRNLCRGIERDDLAEAPEFATPAKRTGNAQAIYEMLSEILITRPAPEWEAIFQASHAIAGVVKGPAEVYEDPQVVANQMFAQFQQPGLGPVTLVNTPLRLSGSADEPRFLRPAPTSGEHTLEVLQELGHSPEEIQALKAEGVVA